MSHHVSRRQFLAAASSFCCAASMGGFHRLVNGQQTRQALIDCHLHIHHRGRTLDETLAHLDATGTDKAFILPLETGEGGVTLTTDEVLDAFRQHGNRIIPFCQCDVRRADTPDRVRRYREAGCQGFGEQKEHVEFGDRRIEMLIALCDELDWPILFHFQEGANGFNQGMAEHLPRYLRRYRKVRIIGHAQTWWAHISAEVPSPEQTLYPKGPVKPGGLLDRLLAEFPNLYADLSAGSGYGALTRDEEFTDGFLHRHWKQLLFGTDCPCRDGRGDEGRGVCYSVRLQEFLRRKIADPEMLQAVVHDNACRALTPSA